MSDEKPLAVTLAEGAVYAGRILEGMYRSGSATDRKKQKRR
jgi:hypothetical protein